LPSSAIDRFLGDIGHPWRYMRKSTYFFEVKVLFGFFNRQAGAQPADFACIYVYVARVNAREGLAEKA
jgi:hypothetical protein